MSKEQLTEKDKTTSLTISKSERPTVFANPIELKGNYYINQHHPIDIRVGAIFPVYGSSLIAENYGVEVEFRLRKDDFDNIPLGELHYNYLKVIFPSEPKGRDLFDKKKPKTIAKQFAKKAIELINVKTMEGIDKYISHRGIQVNKFGKQFYMSRYSALKELFGERKADNIMHELSIQQCCHTPCRLNQ